MKVSRDIVVHELAAHLAAMHVPHPLRVVIDGRTASGKTTLARALGAALVAQGREVIVTSIDGFHQPKAVRYARGRRSPEGYYFDARDLAAIQRLLLAPLGPGGDRRYCTSTFDLETDTALDAQMHTAGERAILLVDGTFLQRPELNAGWDFTVFVRVSEAQALARGVARDGAAMSDVYTARYLPAFDIYDAACAPERRANVIFDNEDFDHPRLIWRDADA